MDDREAPSTSWAVWAWQAYRDGRLVEKSDEIERLEEEIQGMEADLNSAVEVAFKRGATEWTRLNYPEKFKRLSATK